LLVSSARAQETSPLSGVWTLNRSLSEMPREMGFNAEWMPSPARGGQSSGGTTGGGRGRRGSSGGDPSGSNGAFSIPRESYEEARRVDFLTAEARNPPARLMIVDAGATVTITNELGQSRALHPTAKEETLELEGMLIPTTTKRDGDRLVVSYRVPRDREVRHTYSRTDNPSQLVVEVQFLDHGAGDKARRVYDAGTGTATLASPSRAAAAPATGQPAPEKFDARPGAELKGLKGLGVLVEDLSAQAVACGLSHDAIEATVSKRLTDGGFTVRRNSDEDTYLYVNIMTNLSNGLCVSRYDAFLYTHATANLTYRDQPVLVQVSLIHRGGIASGAAVVHTPLLMRGLEGYVDLFVAQIRNANK